LGQGFNNLSTYKPTGQGMLQVDFEILEFLCQMLINEGQTLQT